MSLSKILIAVYVICSSFALIAVKLGTRHGSGAPISFVNGRVHLNLSPYVILGVFLYGTSFLLYMYLISKYDLGYIVPLTTAFIYVIIFLASALIFNEVFTALKIAGIVFITIGLALLNLKSS
jgi:small multidrug resistance pump